MKLWLKICTSIWFALMLPVVIFVVPVLGLFAQRYRGNFVSLTKIFLMYCLYGVFVGEKIPRHRERQIRKECGFDL